MAFPRGFNGLMEYHTIAGDKKQNSVRGRAIDAPRKAEGGDEKPREDLFWKMLIESHIVNEWRGQ